MVTPLFTPENVSGIVELIQFNQTISPFGEIILIAVFAVAFFALKAYETTRALGASLFVTTITAAFLLVLGVLNEAWLYAATVGLAASIWLMYGRDS